MASASYDVPLVIQAANPICWVACLAMVESYWTNSSVGVGKYTGGFDPSDSSIPNPVDGPVAFKMQSYGFYPVYPDQPVTLGNIISMLNQFGPLIFFHQVTNGLPWMNSAGTSGGHAVVITGADDSINGGMLWVNNPWGSKDAPITASAMIPCAAQPGSTSFSFSFGYFP